MNHDAQGQALRHNLERILRERGAPYESIDAGHGCEIAINLIHESAKMSYRYEKPYHHLCVATQALSAEQAATQIADMLYPLPTNGPPAD